MLGVQSSAEHYFESANEPAAPYRGEIMRNEAGNRQQAVQLAQLRSTTHRFPQFPLFLRLDELLAHEAGLVRWSVETPAMERWEASAQQRAAEGAAERAGNDRFLPAEGAIQRRTGLEPRGEVGNHRLLEGNHGGLPPGGAGADRDGFVLEKAAVVEVVVVVGLGVGDGDDLRVFEGIHDAEEDVDALLLHFVGEGVVVMPQNRREEVLFLLVAARHVDFVVGVTAAVLQTDHIAQILVHLH